MSSHTKKYPEEFKREAARLMATRGERSVAEIAESLGVADANLYRWLSKYGSAGGKAVIKETADEAEIRRLRKEVERLKVEREILKKAAAFFAKEIT